MLYKGKKKCSWVLKEELNHLKELYSDEILKRISRGSTLRSYIRSNLIGTIQV